MHNGCGRGNQDVHFVQAMPNVVSHVVSTVVKKLETPKIENGKKAARQVQQSSGGWISAKNVSEIVSTVYRVEKEGDA
jgi:hypothetical protein